MSTNTLTSMLDVIGGVPALRKVIDLLYGKVLDDELLSVYFAGSDIEQVKRGQTALLSMLMSAPTDAKLPSMRGPHRGLLATDQAFDSFVGYLCESLEAVGATAEQISQLRARLQSFRADVVDDFEPNPAYNYARKA